MASHQEAAAHACVAAGCTHSTPRPAAQWHGACLGGGRWALPLTNCCYIAHQPLPPPTNRHPPAQPQLLLLTNHSCSPAALAPAAHQHHQQASPCPTPTTRSSMQPCAGSARRATCSPPSTSLRRCVRARVCACVLCAQLHALCHKVYALVSACPHRCLLAPITLHNSSYPHTLRVPCRPPSCTR